MMETQIEGVHEMTTVVEEARPQERKAPQQTQKIQNFPWERIKPKIVNV